MTWTRLLSRLPGLGPSKTDAVARGRLTEQTPVVAEQSFKNRTIAVSLNSRYNKCDFERCTFLWAGKASGWQAKVFVNCNFNDCNLGIPRDVFRTFAHDPVITETLKPRLTRQQALEQAVKRYYQQRPILTGLCLDPSFPVERQQLADWVRAEYRKIMDEAA